MWYSQTKCLIYNSEFHSYAGCMCEGASTVFHNYIAATVNLN